jgi:hypothetical protein
MPLSASSIPPSTLDKELFRQDLKVAALKVPNDKCNEYLKLFARRAPDMHCTARRRRLLPSQQCAKRAMTEIPGTLVCSFAATC